MILTNDGLTLWYGTADAPAPTREVPWSGSVPLVIGVRPISPANFVDVRYRVDDGPLRMLSARELRSDEKEDAQYFRAVLPLPEGAKRLDYCPVAHSGGIQVPRPSAERSSFTTVVVAARPRAPESTGAAAIVARFTPGLELAAQITVQLKPPTVIGETPNGFRIDYYAKSGTAVGNGFRADVLEDSVDYMLVRPDGVGVLDIHATLKTDDGAMITASYGGLIEFGEDGYQRMRAGDWPDMPKHQVAPRLLTESARYRWMNRTQFVGVGQVDMQALVIKYDIYAVSTIVRPEAWPKR
jgi:hypothetical protein